MSLISSPQVDGVCEDTFFSNKNSNCLQCDVSFINKKPEKELDVSLMEQNGRPLNDSTGKPLTDEDGNPKTIQTISCSYYPIWNKTTQTKHCHQNDTLTTERGCKKIFGLTQ